MRFVHGLPLATMLVAISAPAQITLTELTTIDVNTTADPTLPEYIGSNPVAIAWDGTSAWLAGFNNNAPGNVISVSLLEISTALTTPALGTAFGPQTADGFRGYIGLDVLTDATGTTLVASFDPGSANPAGVTAYDGNGTLLWSKTGRGGGVALDPGFPPNGAAPIGAGWTEFGSGRRLLQGLATGIDLFTQSNGMIINYAPGGSTLWRGIDFDDATGDMYARVLNKVTFARRSAVNGTSSAGILVDLPDNTGFGTVQQNLAVLDTPTGTALIYNNRPDASQNWVFLDAMRAVRPDGTPETLDFGAFTPLNPMNVPNSRNFDFSYDRASNTLAILDITLRSVYIFSVDVPPYYPYGSGCTSSAGQEARLAFAGPGVPGQSLTVELSGAPGTTLGAVLFGIGQLQPGFVFDPLSGCALQVTTFIPGWELTPISTTMGVGSVTFGIGPLSPGFSFECQGVIIDTGLPGVQIAATNGISYRLP